jgi:hypothetical protein
MRWILAAAAALVFAPAANAGGPSMLLGATDDAVRSPTLTAAKATMDIVALAGFRAVRITQVWTPGATAVSAGDRAILRNVLGAAELSGVTVLTSVMNFGSATTPLTDGEQAEFAAYAASVVRVDSALRIVIVGNEPNLNRYWLPQFDANGADAAAPAYVALLARSYDAIKQAAPRATVLGGALAPRGGDIAGGIRPTHSPTVFIQDMGEAYRASGRTRPLMDGFAFHPYEDNSSVAPNDGVHPNTTTIALADYDKLAALLVEAFGTALPIYYDEFGVESQIPAAKQSLYTGTEPATTKPVPEAMQAAYYRQAIQLAFCQPTVRGLMIFHAFDEKALLGWQSGVYYVDHTPKSSLPAVRLAMEQARRGVVARCPGMQLAVHASVAQQGRVLRLTCDLDCTYVAQLYRLPGKLLGTRRGRAIGGQAKALPLQAPAAKASYRLRLSAVAAVNPGKAALLRVPVRPG